jgi:hypothetical protein
VVNFVNSAHSKKDIMKKIKILTVVVLSFISILCFADAAEEERELNEAVLQPIINHFPEDSSHTRVMSKMLIKYEMDKNIQLEPAAAKEKANEFAANPPFNDFDYSCAREAMQDIDTRGIAGFAAKWGLAWHMGIIQCDGYARLALITFYFNMMNYRANNEKPIFKKAALVGTVRGSGDHIFMLAQGDSGTMFAVDPWIRVVKKLPNSFVKLSNVGLFTPKELSPDENKLLTGLFGMADLNGKVYFDGKYVNVNTMWVLEVSLANKIRCMAEMGGPIKTLYEDLNFDRRFPQQVPWFPRWQLPYDRLVQLPAEKVDKSICNLM